MADFFNQVYFGNTITMYITAAIIFIIAVIIIMVIKFTIIRRLKRWAESTKTTVDDFLIRGIEKTIIPLLYFGGLYMAVNTLNLHPRLSRGFYIISIILITFFVIKLIINVIRYSLNAYLVRKGEPETKQRQVRGVLSFINFFIWGIGIIFLLDNLGFEITAVIAGLGIGGIAIALAAQTILGDLFSYFVIFFDRPFEIGDFIIVGDKLGSVEYIGIKTTRIRSLSGEQIIFSNTDLVNSRLHNYKRMERRRVSFSIGVIYQTKPQQLSAIPDIIKNIIESLPDTTFDRAHFAKYGDSSLVFDVVYFVLSPEFNVYMNIHQQLNLRIYEEFEKRGIEFAYPTQTLFLNKLSTDNKKESEIVSL
jgi:small-conductance mechanosensitive channel